MCVSIRHPVLLMTVYAGPWLAAGGVTAAEPPADATTPSAATSRPSTSGEGAPPWRIRPGLLHLNALGGFVGFESEYDQRRVRSSAPRKRDSQYEDQALRLSEVVGLTLAGDVVDPNLVDWHGSFEFGPQQALYREVIDGFHRHADEAGLLLRYDFAVDALKNKPVSFHAYARQSDDRVPRQFLPSLHEYVTEAGASVLVQSGVLTSEAGFSYRDVNRKGNQDRVDNESLEVTRFYLDNKLQFTDTHRLRLSYEHERDKSDYQGSLYRYETTRDEFRGEHELAFGEGAKHRLDTVVRYDNERGDLARNELELSPRLTLQHSDKLQTMYRYSLYRWEQDAIEVGQHKLDAEAIYRPSDRWRFTVDAFALYERLDSDVRTHDYGGQFDIAYNRPTPWGKFSANLAFAYDASRTSGDAGRRLVRNEAHSLSTVKPAMLRERDVTVVSVVAHNAEWTRVFVPGVDYSVVKSGKKVVVYRLPFGRIAEGDVVYFDYQYDVPVHAEVNTYRTDLMLEHEFTFGLTPYYYLETRCQEVDGSAGTPAERDNQHRHRLGARYGRERWTVTNELEVFDDTVEPYKAYHLTGRVNLWRSGKNTLDASGELSRYCFDGGVDRRRVWWVELDLKDRLEINRYFSVTGEATYHYESDSVDGRTHGVDVECGVQYTRGLLTVELVAEYDLLTVGPTKEEGVAVWLRMRRDLGDLLATTRGGLR